MCDGYVWFKLLKIRVCPWPACSTPGHTSLMSLNEHWVAHTLEPPGQKLLVVNGVVVGPFEEEEEGTGVSSDVVKVEGEDPTTPGPLP